MRACVLLLLVSAQLPASLAAAADRRSWKVAGGVSFELSADDLRAWTGDTAGPPVLSMAALLAAEKDEFDANAKDLAGGGTLAKSVAFDVLSIVGPLVSYRESGGGDTPGTAHPYRFDVLEVRDVRRKDPAPSLLDYYSEEQIVQALKADPWLRKFSNPENPVERAASMEDLFGAIDLSWAQEHAEPGDCAFNVTFSDDMFQHFFFHHVEKGRVAVRVAVPPRDEWCTRLGGGQQIGLLLPIPQTLRADLLRAQRGEAGFLATHRPPPFSGTWEVEIRALVTK